jgi:RNA polymerase subunit RPABC4/transcription elongation factor Spt4
MLIMGMRKKMLINKQAKKHFEGKCFFCGLDDYACLNCHRIVPGEEKGIYSDFNTLVVCANCHNKIHDGQIIIDRKYNSTNARGWTLHFWESGEEKWK